MKRIFALFCAIVAGSTSAQELSLPSGARLLTERVSALDSYELPTDVFRDGYIATRDLKGRVERHSWKIASGSLTTMQVLAPLQEQLESAGFEILLNCEARECGGFDFRFATEVIPSPDMYVAIRDYRFLSAANGQTAVSVLVSRNDADIYVQIFQVGRGESAAIVSTDPVPQAEPKAEASKIGIQLTSSGHAALSDLEFEPGAGFLGDGPFQSLRELAVFLDNNPDRRIVLVGHTDNIGSLAQNIVLGDQRAASVRERLTDQYGIDPARIETAGAGYLAPVRSNSSAEGREANRRVEVVLLAP